MKKEWFNDFECYRLPEGMDRVVGRKVSPDGTLIEYNAEWFDFVGILEAKKQEVIKELHERINKEIKRLENFCKKEKHHPYGTCDCKVKIDELINVLEIINFNI